MKRERLQIISVGGKFASVTAHWLKKTDKKQGRQIFYHPDCEIFLVGRNTEHVQHVIMNALQDKNLKVRKLEFVKAGFK